MALIWKFLSLHTQKGSLVAHSPYNILYVARLVGPQPLYLTLASIFTFALCVVANMMPRSNISAMDLPTVLYVYIT